MLDRTAQQAGTVAPPPSVPSTDRPEEDSSTNDGQGSTEHRTQLFDALMRAVAEGRPVRDTPIAAIVQLLRDNTPSPVNGKTGVLARLEWVERAIDALHTRLEGHGAEPTLEQMRAELARTSSTLSRLSAWEHV